MQKSIILFNISTSLPHQRRASCFLVSLFAFSLFTFVFSFAQESKIVKTDTLETANTNQPNSPQAEEGDVDFTDGTNSLLRITDEGTFGAIEIKSGVPTTTTNKLYNDGGTLKFHTTTLGGGGTLELNDLMDAKTENGSTDANVFVGFESGNNIGVSSSSNTSLGYHSLKSLTFGSNNTAVGSSALKFNTGVGGAGTAANNNSAFGTLALTSNTLGDDNTGLGTGANRYNHAGSQNTIIGSLAGSGTALHSKSGNVFIGYKAGYNEIGDDKLYIENSESDSPLLWGDFSTDKLAVNGKLGIGTQNPLYDLQIYNDASPQVLFHNLDTGINGFRIGINTLEEAYLIQGQNQDMFFFTNNSERLRIESNGDVGIGTNDPSDQLHVVANSGQDAFRVQIGSSTKFRILANGGTSIGLNASGTPANGLYVHGDLNYNAALTSVSDKRYKKNIKLLDNPLENISKIRGVTYNWKRKEYPERNFTEKKQIGVIAQEVEEVFPELVSTNKDGYKSVEYTKLTPILLEAVKELKNQNSELEKRLTNIEKQNSELKSLKDFVNNFVSNSEIVKFSNK